MFLWRRKTTISGLIRPLTNSTTFSNSRRTFVSNLHRTHGFSRLSLLTNDVVGHEQGQGVTGSSSLSQSLARSSTKRNAEKNYKIGCFLPRFFSNIISDDGNDETNSVRAFEEPESVQSKNVPDQVLVIPIQSKPFFPTVVAPIYLDQIMTDSLVKWQRNNRFVGLFLKADTPDTPIDFLTPPKKVTGKDIYSVGILAEIHRIEEKTSPPTLHFSGLRRIRITEMIDNPNDSKMMAKIEPLDDLPYNIHDTQIQAYNSEILVTIRSILAIHSHSAWLMEQLRTIFTQLNINNPALVCDLASFVLVSNPVNLQPILEINDIVKRQESVLKLLRYELETCKVLLQINKEVDESVSKSHKKFFLNEQYKSIQKLLGVEKDERKRYVEKFTERIASKTIPEEALRVINEELAKFQSIEPTSTEFNTIRNYLDWLTVLPWSTYKDENYDLARAREILDEDHYGLEDVKKRILEFIAVGALKKNIQGKILCFVGAPGVGKTSIGKSIARALGRDFHRFSVGGISDVSEIKGHRRAYVGSGPGKIIQALKFLPSSNPLILLDEIDKMGTSNYHGDPSAALLELLDPQQNVNFLDHYLDVPYDFSKVLFVCTANSIDNLHPALLDRMEVISLPGYSLEEKVAIATQYLIPKVLKESGLDSDRLSITPAAVEEIITNYSREAGVRSLEKHLEKIARKIAYKIMSNPNEQIPTIGVDKSDIKEYIGTPRYYNYFNQHPPVGVSIGLGFNQYNGGGIIPIETLEEESTPGLEITGRLGEVMKESSQISYTFAKTFLKSLNNDRLKNLRIHMHAPEGSVPKDGPSAGIAMTTALVSRGLNKPIMPQLAMTGEISLMGKVLTIGGVKEKTLAAKRDGMKHIILPISNKGDVDNLPDYIKRDITFYFVDTYNDVYNIAFASPEQTANLTQQPSPATTNP